MCLFSLLGCVKMESLESESSTKKVGKLVLELEKESYGKALQVVEDVIDVKSSLNVLDTMGYRLQISDSKGNIYYDGFYIGRPKEIELPVGTYNIKLRSGEFTEPRKQIPLFGEDRSFKAIADSTVTLQLVSSQLTGGIRVKASEKFMKYFKGTGLYYIKDSVSYKQDYFGSYLYVFFYPGKVSVVYKNKDGNPNYTPPTKPAWEDTVILTRNLKANELVSIDLDYDLARANTRGFTITVDTARIRYDNYYNVGFFAPYGSVSVVYAKTHIGDTVKLWGYIVGGNATTIGFSKKKPFTSKTHIVVAKEDWQSLRENVMAVELPNGAIRNALNLVDHPDLIKRKIVIDGVVADSYFGHAGLRSVTGYKLY